MRLVRRGTPTERAVVQRPMRLWSPAQLIALILGAVATAFGALALARADLDVAHLTRPHSSLLGFGHTPLLAIAEVGFGVLLLLAAPRPIFGRSLMTLLGAAAVGLGVIVIAGWWWAKLTSSLGVTDRNGWLFVAVGGLVLLTAFVAPVRTLGGPRIVERTVPPPTREVEPAETTAATRPEPSRRAHRISNPFRRHQPVPPEPEPERAEA